MSVLSVGDVNKRVLIDSREYADIDEAGLL